MYPVTYSRSLRHVLLQDVYHSWHSGLTYIFMKINAVRLTHYALRWLYLEINKCCWDDCARGHAYMLTTTVSVRASRGLLTRSGWWAKQREWDEASVLFVTEGPDGERKGLSGRAAQVAELKLKLRYENDWFNNVRSSPLLHLLHILYLSSVK